jgi:HAD domain in Swiss Army Knife RNA repair proteins/SMI1 / KNR4 family (SUKH-1)
MTILLDIDGVMVTTPSWKSPEFETDGFMKFNKTSTENLIKLIAETNPHIVLTTTHRINYSNLEWIEIFKNRNINVRKVSKVNDEISLEKIQKRNVEIQNWVKEYGTIENYVIIDDDLSINALSEEIKLKCVQTKPLIGFDNECLEKCFEILKQETKSKKFDNQVLISDGKFNFSKKDGCELEHIKEIEKKLEVEFPEDLKNFYLNTNGIETLEFLFNIISLDNIEKNKDEKGVYLEFAEYMIYSEVCGISIGDNNNYEIFVVRKLSDSNNRLKITNSIEKFIELFKENGLFGIFTEN